MDLHVYASDAELAAVSSKLNYGYEDGTNRNKNLAT
jgi:hypothetical protein